MQKFAMRAVGRPHAQETAGSKEVTSVTAGQKVLAIYRKKKGRGNVFFGFPAKKMLAVNFLCPIFLPVMGCLELCRDGSLCCPALPLQPP